MCITDIERKLKLTISNHLRNKEGNWTVQVALVENQSDPPARLRIEIQWNDSYWIQWTTLLEMKKVIELDKIGCVKKLNTAHSLQTPYFDFETISPFNRKQNEALLAWHHSSPTVIIRQQKDASDSHIRPKPQLKLEYHLNLRKKDHPERDATDFECLISLHFSSLELDPRCTLEILDKHDEIAIALTAGMGPFWSEQIKGLSARLFLNCEADNGNNTIHEEPQFKSSLVIDEYVVIDRNFVQDGDVMRQLSEVHNKRNLDICRDDDLKNAQCYEASHPEAFQVANSVVRMKYANSDFCTGWMISPGLLMTAGHCVQTEEEVLNTQYQFSYASRSCTGNVLETPEVIQPVKLVKSNLQSDYALIQMEGNPGFKYGYLSIENAIPSVDDIIYIPQHPSGRDVELAIVETSPFAAGGLCSVKTNGQGSGDLSCDLYGSSFTDITYYCDTEGGSSGAPVLSATTNKVIGIHHCGATCENFAIPIPEIYNEIIGLVTDDITTAVEATPTMAPTVSGGISGNETDADSTPSAAGKFVLPGLEQDLSRAIGREIAKVPAMTDCMIAPSVYAFEPAMGTSVTAGAFGRSAHAASPVRMVKVEYPAPKLGLFSN
ncbi:MAG: hypothetical protein SGBAC_007799 [Bacillariaceae sp.]